MYQNDAHLIPTPPARTRVSFALPPTADNDNNLNDAYQSCCVFLDEALPVEVQVNQLCKVLYFQLRRISKICSFLTLDAANILAATFYPVLIIVIIF